LISSPISPACRRSTCGAAGSPKKRPAGDRTGACRHRPAPLPGQGSDVSGRRLWRTTAGPGLARGDACDQEIGPCVGPCGEAHLTGTIIIREHGRLESPPMRIIRRISGQGGFGKWRPRGEPSGIDTAYQPRYNRTTSRA
jgi:hypothetical protein